MRPLLLLLVPLTLAVGLEDPQARVIEIHKEAQAKEAAYLRDWLSRANLDPLPLPQIDNPKDARPSEAKALADAKRINQTLALARGIRDRKPLYSGNDTVEDSDIWRASTDEFRKAVLAAQAMKAAPAGSADHR
jgi:hypothetical protein